MNRLKAIQALQLWDKKGKYVFTTRELHKIFYYDNHKTCTEGIYRLVKDNLLVRAYRGIYVNPNARSIDPYVIEHIAKALRYGEYNYVSLESLLSEYGLISQILVDRLTVMTTGRKGVCHTSYGTIEFTHTKRSISEIIHDIKQTENRPLRIVSKQIAWRDLKRVGRNIGMVDRDQLNDD